MNIIQAYTSGFKTAVRSHKMTTLIYIINLMLGLILAIPFMGALKEASNRSLSVHNLLKDIDLTALQEFMRNSDGTIGDLFREVFWVILFFIVVSIFLTGGILTTIKQKESKFTLKSFFSGCGTFFFRFFKLTFYTIILHLILAIIIYLILSLIVVGSYDSVASEKVLFYTFVIFLSLHVIISIYLIVITDYSRFIIVLSDSKKVLKSFWAAVKFVTLRFPLTYGLYLMLLVIPLIVLYLYMIVSKTIGMTSGITILVMFILQQLFIWLRISLRIWTFAGQFDFYTDYSKQVETK
jgi:hypothetical protein